MDTLSTFSTVYRHDAGNRGPCPAVKPARLATWHPNSRTAAWTRLAQHHAPQQCWKASHPRHGKRQRTCVRASASQASDSTDTAGYTPTAYAALAAVLAASSAARLTAPSRYLQLANSAYPDATVQALVRLTGATLIPIVAALWCLKGAAEHDRLGSNTYRRLNLGLAAWAGISAALLFRETSAAPVRWCLIVSAGVYAAVVATCAGAWAGSTGFAPTGRQILDGAVQDVRSLLSWKSALGAALALLAAAAGAFGAAVLLHPLQYFQPASFTTVAGELGASLMRSYGANLLFAAPILVTLKDALDRNRHTSSTFRLLSTAAAATAAAEVCIFYTTGNTQAVLREVVFGAIMLVYRQKEKAAS